MFNEVLQEICIYLMERGSLVFVWLVKACKAIRW